VSRISRVRPTGEFGRQLGNAASRKADQQPPVVAELCELVRGLLATS